MVTLLSEEATAMQFSSSGAHSMEVMEPLCHEKLASGESLRARGKGWGGGGKEGESGVEWGEVGR